MSAPESRFVKACRALPVDRTPVWFMRQAGRYMPEYRAVRKQYSLIEICKRPAVAAEVTITAAEALGVDAAIIFADLLLPLEVMGLPFHFSPGEGPVIEKPVRDQADISRLRTDRAADGTRRADVQNPHPQDCNAKQGSCGRFHSLSRWERVWGEGAKFS